MALADSRQPSGTSDGVAHGQKADNQRKSETLGRLFNVGTPTLRGYRPEWPLQANGGNISGVSRAAAHQRESSMSAGEKTEQSATLLATSEKGP
jgi:hypothetical protein